MGLAEEIKRMQQEGHTDQEIIGALINQGYTAKEIQDFVTQAKIREAVVADPTNIAPSPVKPIAPGSEKMVPSVMDPAQPQPPAQQEYVQEPYPEYPQPESYKEQNSSPYSSPSLPAPPVPASNYPYEDYAQQSQAYQQPYPTQQQDYYSAGISTDTINEIAEQVVAEKLSPLRNKMEEAIDFKNIIESKIDFLDERLKRIERTIDRLQLSVLQKVGDYMTNVEDIKKELIETQKTFKAMLSQDQSKTPLSQKPKPLN